MHCKSHILDRPEFAVSPLILAAAHNSYQAADITVGRDALSVLQIDQHLMFLEILNVQYALNPLIIYRFILTAHNFR